VRAPLRPACVLTKGDSWNSSREATVRLIKWIAYTHRFCNTRAWKNTLWEKEGVHNICFCYFFPSNTRARRPLISYYNNQVTFLKLFQKKSVCTPPVLSRHSAPRKLWRLLGKITPPSPGRLLAHFIMEKFTASHSSPAPMCEILSHKNLSTLVMIKNTLIPLLELQQCKNTLEPKNSQASVFDV